jgi:hypothetical protein
MRFKLSFENDVLLKSVYPNYKVAAAGIKGKLKFKNIINKQWD